MMVELGTERQVINELLSLFPPHDILMLPNSRCRTGYSCFAWGFLRSGCFVRAARFIEDR